MTMNENQREFKVGDRVRYVGECGIARTGYVLGMVSTIMFDEDGMLAVHDRDGDERMFFEDEWEHATVVPTEALQAASALLTSTEALDRFEALLGRLEKVAAQLDKGGDVG